MWRQSQEAYCPKLGGNSGDIDVWSDDRGVFLLTTDVTSRPTIWSNLGAGWQMAFNWPGDTNVLLKGGLKGFVDGPLIVYGGLPCGIQFVDGGVAECSAAENFIDGLVALSPSRAFAVSYNRVLQFDGDFWTQLGDPLPGASWATALWADPSTLVVAALAGYDEPAVFTIDAGSAPVLLPALPPQVDPCGVWSFGASDIWVAGQKGQLVHYDGTGWSEMATIPDDGSGSFDVPGASGKIKLWGQDGSLFVISGNVFGQWDGTRFKVLDSLDSGAYFAGLWGNSPSEVFLAVVARQDPIPLSGWCGPFRVRWFDGKLVGPL